MPLFRRSAKMFIRYSTRQKHAHHMVWRPSALVPCHSTYFRVKFWAPSSQVNQTCPLPKPILSLWEYPPDWKTQKPTKTLATLMRNLVAVVTWHTPTHTFSKFIQRIRKPALHAYGWERWKCWGRWWLSQVSRGCCCGQTLSQKDSESIIWAVDIVSS